MKGDLKTSDFLTESSGLLTPLSLLLFNKSGDFWQVVVAILKILSLLITRG